MFLIELNEKQQKSSRSALSNHMIRPSWQGVARRKSTKNQEQDHSLHFQAFMEGQTSNCFLFPGSWLEAHIMIMRTFCTLTKPVSDVYSGSQIVNIEPKRNNKRISEIYYFAKDYFLKTRHSWETFFSWQQSTLMEKTAIPQNGGTYEQLRKASKCVEELLNHRHSSHRCDSIAMCG